MKNEDCIMFSVWPYWVRKVRKGYYQVLRNGSVAATVVGTFHFADRDSYALARAIEECKARALGDAREEER